MKIKLFLTILVVLGASQEIYCMKEKELETGSKFEQPKLHNSLLNFIRGQKQAPIYFIGKASNNKFIKTILKALKVTTAEEGGFNIDTTRAFTSHTQNKINLKRNKSFFCEWVKPTATFVSAFCLGVAALKAFQYFKASDYLISLPFIGKK